MNLLNSDGWSGPSQELNIYELEEIDFFSKHAEKRVTEHSDITTFGLMIGLI